MDARLYCVQREAEYVTEATLTSVLTDILGDKLALRRRHVAGAEHVASYEFNNAYQYVIDRESTHLAWMRAALQDVGGEAVEPQPVELPATGAERAIIEDDAWTAQAFVDRWRAPVDAMNHVRHRRMLDVVLGETLEHKRFFDLAVDGRTDLLGRRPAGAGTGGGVLPRRWVE